MLNKSKRRVAAASAIAGSVLLSIGTYLHPVPADPNDAVSAFTQYAADRMWIASHLMQLAGVALMLGTLLIITALQRSRRDSLGYSLGASGAVACLAITAALQAVDGIALKHAVNSWFTTPAITKDEAFYAAFAVRQIEVGLASTLSMVLGVTAALYGLAMLGDDTFPSWAAVLALLGGGATATSGVIMAYTGFSDLEMLIAMPANYVLVLWILILSVLMWRAEKAPSQDNQPR